MKKIIKQLLRESFIFEGVSDITYHFTRTNRLISILRNNKINLTAAFGTPSDNNLNKGKLFFLSTTSSRNSDVGYAASLSKNGLVRITLNGRLLKNNYEITRIDYWQRSKDPRDPFYNPTGEPTTGKSFYSHISRQDELEDRLISDKNEIKPANKFIVAIEILNGENLGYLKQLCDNLNIYFYAYDNEAYFNGSVKSKAINVTSGNNDKAEESNSTRVDTDMIAYIVFKDDDLKDKIFNDLKSFNVDVDRVKSSVEKRINDKLNYYLRYEDGFYFNDFVSSMNSNVHNMKSSSNELDRYIIRELGLDMKRNGVKTIKDYLLYKIWKGKKTQNELNKELNNKLINFIDVDLKKQLGHNLDIPFEVDGIRYESIMDFKPFKKIIDEYRQDFKNYVSDFILNNDDVYKLSYLLGSSYIKDSVKIDYNQLSDIINLMDFYGDYVSLSDIKTSIKFNIYDFDSFAYDEIKQAQLEFKEQFK